MLLNRGHGASPDGLGQTLQSLADIGQSLRVTRELAGQSLDEAAASTGVPRGDLEALESGTVNRLLNQVETLRALRSYADSLGLPGDDYVLATVALWPAVEVAAPRTGEVSAPPVVSVSTAPAGGHSPAGASGEVWPGDRTGVTDATISGMVGSGVPLVIHDTGPVPIVDTGEVKAIRQTSPALLKVFVGLVALLVALGCVALIEHDHVSSWYHDAQSTTTHWFDRAKSAAGFSSTPSKRAAPPSAHKLPAVTMAESPATDSVVVNVHASSFSVKMVAFKDPSWIQVTDANHAQPVFQQVLAGGANMTFPVDRAVTVETGSASARAYLYEGTTFIGYYFPAKAPFTMTFNAVG